MSLLVVQRLLMYRNGIVAMIGAGITCMILIIAPLGLFAVIICTLGVFISSLAVGLVWDGFVFGLLGENYPDGMSARQERKHIDAASLNDLDLPTLQQRRQR
ncbi:CRISPR-associated protein Csx18 [Umezakia ovalisporum]|uniref:CRISPR-associated protein Csx18 n=2 Tax=Umezakia ovalisporum TaxID=75695 RepID=A0AA43H223_9CYAN|nr:CRISPR-associated protein Csx18 [Umezakia ovalisporum]MBI1240413.1 hypothetical protein [Nostoc sp. RI_552]MDH6055981.1 CRISPR-associated protein Csx18 [Umezakia ovalisporum FSS-43]MDH6065297.1 CRISPR-associated protein Csx18 [Umezakia ovalisporum FSS-62]MDH6066125.1 CRISPR-associated protein Csx18 [Umezakia ovalisporum APH033B]MDH6072613.1 CRISPR-associated protein Csx18 [Umezakia ovalisporum CobakiLakeA]